MTRVDREPYSVSRDQVQTALERAKATIIPGAEMHTSLRKILDAQLLLLQYIAERMDA